MWPLLKALSFAIGQDTVEGHFMSTVGGQKLALNWDAKNVDFKPLMQGERVKLGRDWSKTFSEMVILSRSKMF